MSEKQRVRAWIKNMEQTSEQEKNSHRARTWMKGKVSPQCNQITQTYVIFTRISFTTTRLEIVTIYIYILQARFHRHYDEHLFHSHSLQSSTELQPHPLLFSVCLQIQNNHSLTGWALEQTMNQNDWHLCTNDH